MTQQRPRPNGFLFDVSVLELADERGEYCGKLLAGAGADVVKVEPPQGSRTRWTGPFYQDDADPERSLHFWHYNLGKRGVTLDVTQPEGQARLKDLVRNFDVLVETFPPGYLNGIGLGYETLREINPRLIMTSITPFGQSGPRRDWKSSDLVHLALGGIINCCGYDPLPNGEYDTPPIAPQMWHASHIVGNHAYMAIVAALLFRAQTGKGQFIDAPVHRAVSVNTEMDIPFYVYHRQAVTRQMARHAYPDIRPAHANITKDGRYVHCSDLMGGDPTLLAEALAVDGMADDLFDPKYRDAEYRKTDTVRRHINDVVRQWVAEYPFDADLWHKGQARRLHWAPIRRPEENLDDPHWGDRGSFAQIRHDDIDRTLTYPGQPWLSATAPWRSGPRAPHLGEHNDDIFGEELKLSETKLDGLQRPSNGANGIAAAKSLPFAIENVRITDLTWVLAGAGGPRMLASLGAEDIRVEWKDRLDLLRSGGVVMPLRPEDRARILAGEPFAPKIEGKEQGATFNENNPGKRGIGLNLRHPKGKELFKELVRISDVVVENFTALTMERLGLGYEELRKINPSLIYVQQPGFGRKGRYADYVATGPVAQAISGLTEQSGLPSPHPPAGWGYSYLDWSGAYFIAMAILSALYYRDRTGEGQYIDSSQAEPGMYLTGTAILDYVANGRPSQRTGNRSPYVPAAPHGVYRCAGQERWIAISVYDDEQWRALLGVLGNPTWADGEAFDTLDSRVARQDTLDPLMEEATRGWDPFDLMEQLQTAGVAAGVCQTAQDRMERDPQLAHLGFQKELRHSLVGTWPVKDFPVHLSESPAYVGGTIDRAAPLYAEDNDYVFGTLLGLTESDRISLREEDVI